MVQSCPKEGVRPVLKSHEYALPGDKLDTFDLWIFDIDKRSAVKVDADRLDWDWPPPVHWEKDSSCLYYRQMYRGYQRYTVRKVDPETGLVEIIIDETTDTSMQPSYEYLYYVENTNELIWASERDGWHHLYLFDRTNGKLKNQITKGDWFVRRVIKVDDDKRQIIFTANGREEGEDPYLIHYYKVNFDGTGLVNLTPGNGNHNARFSPDWKYLVDNYSRVDLAPVTVLRSAEDDSLICELEEADIEPLLATGWRWPEPFCAKGRDGTTDIYGVIYRPRELDESKKYPVIEMIYTGPHSSHVPKRFRNSYWVQALCELGFIVVQVDGMGTGNRSKAFHDVSYKNLGDCGLPDHIAWLRAAEEKYPYIDASNVGVTGGSAGGYDATRALITHPEVYKAAISSSGNHDHRTDKVWWNELWMGYPVTDVYKEQSNIENADKIEGALFLIHGEMDNNVNCAAATMQLVNALIKANKDFEFLVVPGGGHCPGGDYITRRQWDFFVKNLQGVEPPKGFKVGDRSKQ
jgi:dipeptidyl aminopeptidase/acylaminoacyl peptidase